jgi:hypothetical protein
MAELFGFLDRHFWPLWFVVAFWILAKYRA